MGTTSNTSNAIFTGSSQFSSDFQQVISRAVSLASLPMQSVQADVTTLTSQSTEWSTLNTKLGALQSAVNNLASAMGQGSYTVSSSTAAAATATLTGTPLAGSFTVEVDSAGAYSTATSSDGLTTVPDPAKSSISTAATYQLDVGDTSFTIAPQSNTLSSLATAINSSDAGVQATVVNLGSAANPDFRLSLQGTQLGDLPIQLSSNDTNPDGSTSQTPLLTAGDTPGAPATYRINGKPPSPADPLTSSSPTITPSPGVSVTLLAAGTTTITVAQNTLALGGSLQGFVAAYNAVTSEIDNNRGSGTGALQGQSILATLSQTLQQVSGYSTGNSGISSLTSLGLTFDDKGILSFNPAIFSQATAGNLAQLNAFLGSTSTGGFLKAANDALTHLTDPVNGTMQTGIHNLQSQITRDNQSIGDQQDRINTLQNNLNSRMAAADSAIAAMEQQYSYLSAMFTAMQVNARNGY